MLIQRFRRCSTHVKIVLFRTFCICLYGAALWSCYKNSTMLKLKYCYHKCMKKFFGYNKFHSVTEMLLDLGLPSFDTVIHYRHSFSVMWSNHYNAVIQFLRRIWGLLTVFKYVSVSLSVVTVCICCFLSHF